MSTEKYQFQAESRQLLDLMIHSIYSNKEIFLRELISNSSDALDKLRLLALSDSKYSDLINNLEIKIEADAEKRRLIIEDNGIGMNKEELINNLGTIAQSGTREFLKKMKDSGIKDEFIGQFGVGFYSVFMVSERVEVLTKKAGEDKAYLWVSTGNGEFEISDAEKTGNGTIITLYLKKAEKDDDSFEDYTDTFIIRKIIKKYSDYISYPIKLKEYEEDDKKNKVEKWNTVNSMKPLWLRSKNELKEEDLEEFYRHISHDWNKYSRYIQHKAEGQIEYNALLFIPAKAPFDFYYQGYKSGLQLYVKKVLILEHCEDLLPSYLRFVKGVVDSPDLPLNISREMLQKDKKISIIKKNLTTKVLDTLKEFLDENREEYLKIYKEFGNAFKEGIGSDFENKEKIADLLLFQSSNSPTEYTTFKEYKSRMKEGQKEIYYITGESREILENSPHIERLKEKGYEVIYMVDPIDEIMMQYLHEYDKTPLKSAAKGQLDLDSKEEKKKKEEELKKEEKIYEKLINEFKENLKDVVKDVKLTDKLVSAPACLSSEEYEMSSYMEKLLKKSPIGLENPVKRTLELNPNHSIIVKLNNLVNTGDKETIKEYCDLIYNYAALSESGEVKDPVKFNKILLKIMDKSL